MSGFGMGRMLANFHMCETIHNTFEYGGYFVVECYGSV